MKEASAVVFLVARLLLMGPEGTQTLSEHRAHVPFGGTGLIQESLTEPGLPESLALYLAPSRGAPEEDGAPAPVQVRLRSDLWAHAAAARAGAAPDERNNDLLVLDSGSALVQIAESSETGLRLMLSLASPPEEPEIEIPGRMPVDPVPVSFVVELYRSAGTEREPLSGQTLRTLEGRAVSWTYGWKRPKLEAGPAVYVDEGVTLTLTPLSRSEGWISVEAKLVAHVQAEPGSEPADLVSSATRTVALGIPFEISLATPTAGEAAAEDPNALAGGEPGKKPEPVRFLVQITPFLPASVNQNGATSVHER